MFGFGKKLFELYKGHPTAPIPKDPTASAPTAAHAPSPAAAAATAAVAEPAGENKWRLSNLAAIGSAEDKAQRAGAANAEDAFQGAGTAAGVQVWRVEKFSPQRVHVRGGNNLMLYSGDAYIVLRTEEKEAGWDWQLHYWIGKDCSQDESGAAAYYTVNLDDLLNQKPVQHREMQYNESALFHSYFDSVTYLDGGIDSGFTKAEPDTYKPRLLQMVNTGTTVRVIQVPLLPTSLNNGDVFVLDNGLVVYQFNAPNADFKERRRAMEIVEQDIKAERDGEPDVIYLDGIEVFECTAFWELLGGTLDELPDASADLSDEAAADDPDFTAHKKLYKISDEDGDLHISMEKEGDVSEGDVNEDDIWAVACDGRLFIYAGAAASRTEKFYVWNNCDAILGAADLHPAAPVTFVGKDTDVEIWGKLFS